MITVFYIKALFVLLFSSFLIAGDYDKVKNLNPFNSGIILDGYLTEEVWKNATRITDFHTFQPVEGNPAEERTALLLGYDANNLYMAVICFYDNPGEIRASITKRDDIFEDDYVILFLDTFDDGKTAYQFGFNPYGIQADGIYTEYVGEDYKPDFLYESHGRIFQQGYIVEAQIPFSSLSFPDKKVMDWRFGAIRRTQYVSHDVVWPAFTINSTEWVGQFGKLSNITKINTGKRIDILPEFSSFRQDNFNAASNSLKNGPIKGEAGINASVGITSGLHMDVTYNPDFSQVESDANKIDINRVKPLQYSEKRQFFLENTDIFETPIQAVYTRQLVNPLAGIKLSGRVGEYSLGLLGIIDEYQGSDAYLNNFFLTDSAKSKYSDKNSINNIIRLKRNILENSEIGLLVTDREFEDSYNRVFGIDGRFSLSSNDVLTVQGLFSQTREIGIKKEMSDPAIYLKYWRGSSTWNTQILYNDYAPQFRVANGFIERSDIIAEGFREAGAQIWYNFQWRDSPVLFLRPYIFTSRIFDYNGRVLEDNFWLTSFFRFKFQTELDLTYYYSKERFGGIDFPKNNYAMEVNNASLSWLETNFYLFLGDEIYYYSPVPFLGYVKYATAGITFKPLSVLNINLSYLYYGFTGGTDGINYGLTQEIPRLKMTWQLSRHFALRVIGEQVKYENYGDFEFNFLFSYTPSPGTVIYLGYNDYQQMQPGFKGGWLFEDYRRVQRGFFMKLSYLFRL